MGCVNGKHPLTKEDLDFISTHTEIGPDEVKEQYENFLTTYPDGKITRRSFK